MAPASAGGMQTSLGNSRPAVEAALKRFDSQGIVRRIWDKDAAVWKADPGHQTLIRNMLGWLTVIRGMQKEVPEIQKLALEIRAEGFKDIVLLGMGGSSLCPLVLKNTFGKLDGFPELSVLDTTDPAAILNLEKNLDLKKTLWIVSSKSGGTAETECLFHYFFDKAGRGKQYIAITDSGTSLEKLGRARKFRRVFLNPSDIGGRYSGLSFFGMVPAALMGLDAAKLLIKARAMMEACGPDVPAAQNPGAVLGACLGELHARGRDKITFACGKPIRAFGMWAEQLLAESTGKDGLGLVPVEGEPLGPPEVYSGDRVFIGIQARAFPDSRLEQALKALEEAGHPVIRITLETPEDLAAEFFRFEFATAAAGSILQIDPFDQPNVQESKDNTKAVLEIFKKEKKLPEPGPAVRENGLAFYACHSEQSEESALKADSSAASRPRDDKSISEAFSRFLQKAEAGDYIALMAYLEPCGSTDALLDAVRLRLRDGLKIATTVGYGPRFLHSTGQLHKGGADNGLFLQLTAGDAGDLPIPGEPYGFSVLKQAQALGDYFSLLKHGRRLARIHLGNDIKAGLEKVLNLADEAVTAKKES